MTCEAIQLEGGGRGILCGSFKPVERCVGGHPATALCDYVIGKRGRTCDMPLCEVPGCEDCTYSPGANLDYCARHALIVEVKAQMRVEGATQLELPL